MTPQGTEVEGAAVGRDQERRSLSDDKSNKAPRRKARSKLVAQPASAQTLSPPFPTAPQDSARGKLHLR